MSHVLTNGTERTLDPGVIRERLEVFSTAWSLGDIDTLMTFVTEDCVYGASVGPEPGETFVGAAAVREGFERMLRHDAAGTAHGGRIVVAGTVAWVEWAYVFADDAGRETMVRGCDLFEFRGDKISRKDAFRKTAGPPASRPA
jgi:ketosteroid isomerase-like protein